MRRSPRRPAGFVCHLCAPQPSSSYSSRPLLLYDALPHPRAQPRRSPVLSRRWSSTSAAPATAPAFSSPSASPASSSGAAAAAAAAATTTTTTTTTGTTNHNFTAPNPDPISLASIAEDSAAKFLSVDGIPAPQLTAAALQSCLRAASALHPLLRRAEAHAQASASRLSQLGAERLGTRPTHNLSHINPALSAASSRISRAALAILSHSAVEITPSVLEAYVRIHAQLGRPESLPHVLALYAHKPKPVPSSTPSTSSSSSSASGPSPSNDNTSTSISLRPRNPNAPSRAVDPSVADAALQTAIDARHLDAALGIIEAAYCTPAFKRHKLLKHASAPAIGIASLPLGISGLASAYAAYWQNTMDVATASGIAAAGISGYFLVVGSLGLIAKLSNKDQMKRVTWTPGTPLRYRWIREDERAALDKVACAWGFREPWRHGEETGPEWEGLKEYMGYRGMLLDRVEFMEGMN